MNKPEPLILLDCTAHVSELANGTLYIYNEYEGGRIRNGNEARELAAWLLKAAEWMEEKE